VFSATSWNVHKMGDITVAVTPTIGPYAEPYQSVTGDIHTMQGVQKKMRFDKVPQDDDGDVIMADYDAGKGKEEADSDDPQCDNSLDFRIAGNPLPKVRDLLKGCVSFSLVFMAFYFSISFSSVAAMNTLNLSADDVSFRQYLAGIGNSDQKTFYIPC